MSVADAIRAHTLDSAFASFEEDRKGSLEPGKMADITVLSRNLLEIPAKEFLETEVLYTIVGGRIVYQRAATP